MVKKIGEDRFPKTKTRKGARPRTIPKTEEELQERLRLMEEVQKKASNYIKKYKPRESKPSKPSWLFWFLLGLGIICIALVLIALLTMI